MKKPNRSDMLFVKRQLMMLKGYFGEYGEEMKEQFLHYLNVMESHVQTSLMQKGDD